MIVFEKTPFIAVFSLGTDVLTSTSLALPDSILNALREIA
jgi:hypothetical protein